MARTGRPPKDEEDRRESHITVRLTAAEKRECEAASGDLHVSTWGRDRLLAAARRSARRK